MTCRKPTVPASARRTVTVSRRSTAWTSRRSLSTCCAAFLTARRWMTTRCTTWRGSRPSSGCGSANGSGRASCSNRASTRSNGATWLRSTPRTSMRPATSTRDPADARLGERRRRSLGSRRPVPRARPRNPLAPPRPTTAPRKANAYQALERRLHALERGVPVESGEARRERSQDWIGVSLSERTAALKEYGARGSRRPSRLRIRIRARLARRCTPARPSRSSGFRIAAW